MTKRKYCYEYTDYRQYKCCECGRTMHEPAPHICNGQYRKYKIKFVKCKKDRIFELDMLKSKDIQAVSDSWRISVNGVELGDACITDTSSISAEPTMPPQPINISFSVDMDKEKFDEFASAFRLYDESIKLRRAINGIIHAYADKTAANLGNPLDYYRHLCHNGNCALAYIAMIKKRKRIFGI